MIKNIKFYTLATSILVVFIFANIAKANTSTVTYTTHVSSGYGNSTNGTSLNLGYAYYSANSTMVQFTSPASSTSQISLCLKYQSYNINKLALGDPPLPTKYSIYPLTNQALNLTTATYANSFGAWGALISTTTLASTTAGLTCFNLTGYATTTNTVYKLALFGDYSYTFNNSNSYSYNYEIFHGQGATAGLRPYIEYTPINTCTVWTYSNWSACTSSSTQSRTVLTSSPAGCSGGSPVISQYCEYITNMSIDLNSKSTGIFSLVIDFSTKLFGDLYPFFIMIGIVGSFAFAINKLLGKFTS